MGRLKQRFDELMERYRALSGRKRMGLIFGLSLAAVLGLIVYAYARPTRMGVLFSDLSPEDTSRITTRLAQMGVPYERGGQDGNMVRVPEDRVDETRMTLAASGLPGQGGVGFEVFDHQRFGESEFSEQVRYHRALEGELSRTISHLSGVDSARVHLVLPGRSIFQRSEEHASASVVVHLLPGFQLTPVQTRGVVHLVASAVRGLSTENVTVVDGQGRPIPGGEQGAGDTASDSLDLRHQLESQKERSLQELLDRTLGPGQAEVRVAAEISMAHEERTEERFLPDETATRSFQIQTEGTSAIEAATQGVPGAASNLPGGAPATTTPGTAGMGRQSETRNFEVSKTTRHAVEPAGRLTRLNVAVVVDGMWSGEGRDRSFTPLPQAELDRIQSIVATAGGIDSERGDHVTVACVPFTRAADAAADTRTDDILAPYRRYLPLVKLGAVALLGLVLLIFIWRLRRRWRIGRKEAERTRQSKQLAGPALPGAITVGELEARLGAGMPPRAALATGGANVNPDEIQVLAAELAAEDPARAARIMRGWLEEAR